MRVLALIGTVAVWSPVALMLLMSAISSSRADTLRMDYLIPAELFLLVVGGGALLSYLALRTGLRRRLVHGSFALAVLALILTQVLAAVTGLASGARQPEGLPWLLVVALLAIYDLAVVMTGVGGLLLLRDLSHKGIVKIQ